MNEFRSYTDPLALRGEADELTVKDLFAPIN